ncbi:MAG: EF-hand domain-containing protein [Bacteroidota bacterium]
MKNVSKTTHAEIKTGRGLSLLVTLLLLVLTYGCNTQKTATDTDPETTAKSNVRPERGQQRGQRPSVDEIFAMDANKDGKLAKSEVKGPLLQEFDRIDTDEDGFLSREEVENAPKPARPPRRGGGPQND